MGPPATRLLFEARGHLRRLAGILAGDRPAVTAVGRDVPEQRLRRAINSGCRDKVAAQLKGTREGAERIAQVELPDPIITPPMAHAPKLSLRDAQIGDTRTCECCMQPRQKTKCVFDIQSSTSLANTVLIFPS